MRKVAFVLVCSFAMISSAHGSGLRTTFVRVALENLQVGNTYNIREMANLPLAVYNTGDQAVDLAVEATIPIKGEFREGYEPIPDASWIVVRQDTFRQIEPGDVVMTDVLISIPDVDEHLGRKYQAMIWSHTVGQGMIACGLKSEVLFGISRERGSTTKTIYVLPTEIYVTDVEVGKIVDIGDISGGMTLKIFNPSEEDKQIVVESIRCGDSPFRPEEGYLECPEPDFLLLAEREFTLPKHDEKEMKIYVAFPRSTEYVGNKYLFIIGVTVADEAEPGLYSKIYVALKE
jgi:hypothetical protein